MRFTTKINGQQHKVSLLKNDDERETPYPLRQTYHPQRSSRKRVTCDRVGEFITKNPQTN